MRKILIIIGPLILLLVWLVFSSFNIVNPLLLPSPFMVFKVFCRLFISTEIIPHLGITLYRTIIGLLGALIIGVPVGVIMGYWLPIYQIFEFIIDFFRSLPATALFPLFMLWFGIGDKARISLVTFASSLILLVYSYYGVRHSKIEKREVAKIMGASSLQILKKVILPEALPEIIAGIRISLSLALVLVVVTEMFVGAEKGLGVLIYNARYTYRIPEVFAVILVTGVLGFCLNKLVTFIEQKKIHWVGK